MARAHDLLLCTTTKLCNTCCAAAPQVHHGFGNTLVRGIFANWLVGIATWQANAAQDLSGKAIAIWWAAKPVQAGPELPTACF